MARRSPDSYGVINLHMYTDVQRDHSGSQIAFVCYIECTGIPITRLNFITAVSRLPDSKALPAKVIKSDYKKAFISYSRKDENGNILG